MLEIIIKIFCALVYAILDFEIMKKMLQSDEKIYAKKNIFLLIMISASYILLYTDQYSITSVILKFSFGIVMNCIIFNTPLYKTVIAYIIYMMLALVADLLNTAVYLQFIPMELIRTNKAFMILTNTTVAITLYLILKIKFLVTKLQQLVGALKKDSNLQVIIFYALIYVILIIIFYKIISVYKINFQNMINYIIAITAFVALIIYTINRLNYSNLLKEYDLLFNYVQQFEDSIDSMDLTNHEYKNQLAVLKGYIEENEKNKALSIINDMTNEMYKQDGKIISELKNIPKGGIKGLLYYKVMVSKKYNLNICIDVSKTVTNKIKKLKIDEIKIISRLIGIYLDNAIEAASTSRKKMVVIEVYSLNDEIQFVFSNTYKDANLNVDQFEKRGYTTKGKGHGKGLYLAKKMISRNNWLSAETKIVNKLYTQKLIIKNIKK